mmetsp:Transcript_2238/g.5958  ORF Transcript_2238/g.5958 Transcript_2238/m.5958 type:complete len:425 (-) Transcript_2238:774-2048(-)
MFLLLRRTCSTTAARVTQNEAYLPLVISRKIEEIMRDASLRSKRLVECTEELSSALAKNTVHIKQLLSDEFQGGDNLLVDAKTATDELYSSAEKAAAYSSLRFPSTYAANMHVFTRLAALRPGFVPASVLDFGSGSGAAICALQHVYGEREASPAAARQPETEPESPDNGAAEATTSPVAFDVLAVERSSYMKAVGRKVVESFGLGSRTSWASSIDEDGIDTKARDVVIASYSLGEAVACSGDKEELDSLVEKLWAKSSKYLVIIEAGGAGGFSVIKAARSLLLTKPHAKILAPCLHSETCPMAAKMFCSFGQHLDRPRFQRNARQSTKGHESEKFSYIVVERASNMEHGGAAAAAPEPRPWGRLIRPALKNKRHVMLDVCASNGTLERRAVAKKDEGYKEARKAQWGDVWETVPRCKPSRVTF